MSKSWNELFLSTIREERFARQLPRFPVKKLCLTIPEKFYSLCLMVGQDFDDTVNGGDEELIRWYQTKKDKKYLSHVWCLQLPSNFNMVNFYICEDMPNLREIYFPPLPMVQGESYRTRLSDISHLPLYTPKLEVLHIPHSRVCDFSPKDKLNHLRRECVIQRKTRLEQMTNSLIHPNQYPDGPMFFSSPFRSYGSIS